MRIRKKEIGNFNIVGQKIEKIRKETGIKQKELLAQLQIKGIEITSSGLSKIEGQFRKVTDYELKAFAEILGVSVESLLED